MHQVGVRCNIDSYFIKIKTIILTEIKKAITVKLLQWAFNICPTGLFKVILGVFLHENIMDL